MICCILAAYLFGRMCLAVRWAYRKLLRRAQPVAAPTMPTPTRALSSYFGGIGPEAAVEAILKYRDSGKAADGADKTAWPTPLGG